MRRSLLALLAASALALGAGCSEPGAPPAEAWSYPAGPSASGGPSAPAGPVVAKVAEVLGKRPLFGVNASDPEDPSLSHLAEVAGCRPALVKIFAALPGGISAEKLRALPGVPVLSIEPWETGKGANQPRYTLRATIRGDWDAQYRKIAQSVVAYGKPILIRFGHEMNGRWYPWGVANGNKASEFPVAWRHVVDLFRKAGATNALWVWSPNVIRGAQSQTIAEFWPGKAYVDVVGLTGYGVSEQSPSRTYDATMTLIKRLTDKPVVLTEVGAKRDSDKTEWISNFGPWLKAHPQVAGFIWNQVVRDGDWRYDDTPANLAAFRRSLAVARVSC